MGLYSALNSGLSGISTYQKSVEIVGNNISNVNNPDYSRQKSVLSTKPTLQIGRHIFGQGVALEDIKREYDVFVSNQVMSKTCDLGKEEVKAQPLAELERIFGVGDNSLAKSIDNFFHSWMDLTQNPSGEVERDYVIQQGQHLASSFDSIRDDLVTVKKNINDKLLSTKKSSKMKHQEPHQIVCGMNEMDYWRIFPKSWECRRMKVARDLSPCNYREGFLWFKGKMQ
jgi:flagellar hook-associated protein 1 FlgK